jgi:excisionase family DNA binding protein
MPSESLLLSLREACELLGVGRTTLHKLIGSKQLVSRRFGRASTRSTQFDFGMVRRDHDTDAK